MEAQRCYKSGLRSHTSDVEPQRDHATCLDHTAHKRKHREIRFQSRFLCLLRAGQGVLSSWVSYVRDQKLHASRKKKKSLGLRLLFIAKKLNREALSVF